METTAIGPGRCTPSCDTDVVFQSPPGGRSTPDQQVLIRSMGGPDLDGDGSLGLADLSLDPMVVEARKLIRRVQEAPAEEGNDQQDVSAMC